MTVHIGIRRYHNTRTFHTLTKSSHTVDMPPSHVFPPVLSRGAAPSEAAPQTEMIRILCRTVLLNAGLDGLGVRADNLANLLAVLKEDESGHGADAEFLCDIGDFVDVELVEARVGVLLGEPGVALALLAMAQWCCKRT